MGEKKLKITFVTAIRCFQENANSIHQFSFFKGLAELGHDITVLTYEKRDNANNYKFIKFVEKSYKTKNNYFARAINRIRSIKLCQNFIIQQKQNREIDLLVILTADFFSVNDFLRTAKKVKIPVVHERGEYPFVVKPNLPLGNFFVRLYLNYLIPQFNGIFVASKALEKYFTEYANPECVLKIIPALVEVDAFKIKELPIYKFKYIAYCGTLYGDKDGVPIMIKAFKKFSLNYPEIKLIIAGNNSDKVKMQEINALVEGFEDKIIFTGYIGRKAIVNLLNNALALLLARPANKQAEGGFPSKIGEYLSTGNPVIVTNVGEISNYLIDGVNAFIAKPDSVNSFYDKMENLFQNFESSKKIGKEGEKVAIKYFDYKVQSKELELFFYKVYSLYQ